VSYNNNNYFYFNDQIVFDLPAFRRTKFGSNLKLHDYLAVAEYLIRIMSQLVTKFHLHYKIICHLKVGNVGVKLSKLRLKNKCQRSIVIIM
jgi:hypothetical protein